MSLKLFAYCSQRLRSEKAAEDADLQFFSLSSPCAGYKSTPFIIAKIRTGVSRRGKGQAEASDRGDIVTANGFNAACRPATTPGCLQRNGMDKHTYIHREQRNVKLITQRICIYRTV